MDNVWLVKFKEVPGRTQASRMLWGGGMLWCGQPHLMHSARREGPL